MTQIKKSVCLSNHREEMTYIHVTNEHLMFLQNAERTHVVFVQGPFRYTNAALDCERLGALRAVKKR